MATKILILAIAVVGIVKGNHIYSNHDLQNPHLCDAYGESREGCEDRIGLNINDIYGNGGPRGFISDVSSLIVRFFLYKNPQNPNDASEIFSGSVESIRSANPYPMSPNTEWKILIPGFPMNGKSPFPQNVLDAYMERMRSIPDEKYNILVVDWNQGPCKYDTNFQNTTYTGAVGEKVAEMLLLLNEHNFLSLRNDAHVIGFSAGAHVAGEASRVIFRKFNKKNLLYRITALDPAGNRFWPQGLFENIDRPTPWERVPRIRRSFVGFLDVIHTSKEYGIGRITGDIDFFPNGGDSQPGCNIGFLSTKLNNFKDLCSHVYATELFAQSINDKSLVACTGCDYYDQFERNKCPCEDKPILGEFVDDDTIDGYPRASGKAWILTGDLRQFGKRFQTTLEKAGEPRNNRKKWTQLCD